MSITFVKDLAERVVASVVVGWAAIWVVLAELQADQLFDVEVLKAVLLIGVGAAVKALVARRIGDPESASLSPDV